MKNLFNLLKEPIGIMGSTGLADWFSNNPKKGTYLYTREQTKIEDDLQRSSIVVYKETTEDWYPSYTLKNDTRLLCVSFHNPVTVNNSYMVSVWGADDFGMEYQTLNKDEALHIFETIISLKKITIKQLQELNLQRA